MANHNSYLNCKLGELSYKSVATRRSHRSGVHKDCWSEHRSTLRSDIPTVRSVGNNEVGQVNCQLLTNDEIIRLVNNSSNSVCQEVFNFFNNYKDTTEPIVQTEVKVPFEIEDLPPHIRLSVKVSTLQPSHMNSLKSNLNI